MSTEILLNSVKGILPLVVPQLLAKSEPTLRAKIKEVIPLDDTIEDNLIKAITDAIVATGEVKLNVDLDGDGKIGSVTFND